MSKTLILFGAVALFGSSVTLAAPFTDTQNGYSLNAPQGWQKQTVPGTAVYYMNADRRSAVSVIVQPAPRVTKLEGAAKTSFLDTVFSALKTMAQEKGATRVVRSETSLGGESAVDIQYALKDGLTYEMVVTALDGRAYLLGFVAPTAHFAKQQALYKTLKTSFKLSKQSKARAPGSAKL